MGDQLARARAELHAANSLLPASLPKLRGCGVLRQVCEYSAKGCGSGHLALNVDGTLDALGLPRSMTDYWQNFARKQLADITEQSQNPRQDGFTLERLLAGDVGGRVGWTSGTTGSDTLFRQTRRRRLT